MSNRIIVFGAIVALCVTAVGWSAEKGKRKPLPPIADPVEVKFFEAMESGQIKVLVVAPNYSQMMLRVQNTTDTPLRVLLPETIDAVPAARRQVQQTLQRNGMPASLANNYGPSQGGSQGLGGSLAGPWSQDPSVAGQRNAQKNGKQNPQPEEEDPKPLAWTLAPGQLIQLQIPCFCLEFGKPDPNRKIPYEMVQLQDLNGQPAVQELIKRFAQGDIDQRVAQLAAWHIASGTPWPMLAQLKLPRTNGRGGPVSQRELMAAKTLAESLPSYGQQRSLGDR